MKRRRVAKLRRSAGPAGDGRSNHAEHGPGSGESLFRFQVGRLSVRRPRSFEGDGDKPCQTRLDAELYVIAWRREACSAQVPPARTGHQ